MHDAAAEQVQMKMLDGLAAVVSCVDDGAVTFVEALLAGDFSDCREQMAQQRRVFWGGVGERGDVLARYDQDMHGRVRMNVGEGDALVVFVHASGGDGAIDDFAEETVHSFPSVRLVSAGQAGPLDELPGQGIPLKRNPFIP